MCTDFGVQTEMRIEFLISLNLKNIRNKALQELLTTYIIIFTQMIEIKRIFNEFKKKFESYCFEFTTNASAGYLANRTTIKKYGHT